MKVQVQKWGNSLALRIPKSFANESHIEQGSTVEVSIFEGSLIIKPIRKKKYSLEELLGGVTEKNKHGEINTGPSVGNEAW